MICKNRYLLWKKIYLKNVPLNPEINWKHGKKTQVLPLIQFFQKLLSIISALQDKLSWKYTFYRGMGG